MISIQDLSDIVYASGSVFNGLATNRLDTRNFLATGSTQGVNSRADLALLQDLKDVSAFIVRQAGRPVDADYIIAVNSLITRSGALSPGHLRSDDDHIGVDTRYGRHEPAAVSHDRLNELARKATSQGDDPIRQAASLFVYLSMAQPFMDGNKRTALFAAEGYLLYIGSTQLLSLPTRDMPGGTEAVETFNDLLARAYIMGDMEAVTAFLCNYALPIPSSGRPA